MSVRIAVLNPNHPMMQLDQDTLYKLLAFVVWKYGTDGAAVIDASDVARFPQGAAMAMHEHADHVEFRICSADEAHALAREQGGLPQ